MKKYLVIGNPIQHSLSPKLHNYWIKKNNIDAVYDRKKINKDDIKDIITEVRNGKITREEAVMLVKKFDNEFPQKYFKEFLDYIEISEKKFLEIIDSFRSPHLWKYKSKKSSFIRIPTLS